jgi:hypothetical protein
MTNIVPQYDQGSTGAVNRPFTQKLQETVSVKDFGATGNGTTDDTGAIQAAIDYIVGTGQPNSLHFPSGTYKITSGLTINAGYVSCIGDRAILNFSTVGDIACITFIGGNAVSGQPYNQSDCCFEGFKIVGPSTSVATGLYFNTASSPGPASVIVRDCNINTFNVGVKFYNNSYLITLNHCDIWGCYRGVQGIASPSNGGENIRLLNSAIYNCTAEGFRNESSTSDYNFFGVSIDGCPIGAIVTAGQVSFTGCHFEYSAVANTALSISANTFVTCTGCYFLNTYASQNQYIINNGYLTIYGGRIACANTATNIVYSTNRLVLMGCHIQSTSSTPITATGYSLIYLPNIGNLISSGVTGTNFQSTSGVYLGGVNVTLSVLSTWYSLGLGTTNGLFVFRDNTSGGTAAFVADSSNGANALYNGITGFQMNYGGVSGQMSIRVTSGTVPRNISFTVLQTGS